MKLLTKLLLTVSVMLTGGFLFVSCDNKDNSVLRLSGTTCNFTAEGGQKVIEVGTNEKLWKASLVEGNTSHFILSSENNKFTISSDINTTADIITAKVAVEAGSETLFVNIVQSPGETGDFYITPDVKKHVFQSFGGTYIAYVTASGTWTATSDQSWCTVKYDNASGSVVVTTKDYKGTEERSAVVTISTPLGNGSLTRTLDITQATRATDPYYMLAGVWHIYSDKWLNGLDEKEWAEGTYATLKIVPKAVNESFYLENLFMDGMMFEIGYNVMTKNIDLPIGYTIAFTGNLFYWYGSSYSLSSASMKHLKGIVSEDRLSIELVGLNEGEVFGLYQFFAGEGLSYIPYLFYTYSPNVKLVKAPNQSPFDYAPSAQFAAPAKAVSPNLDNSGKFSFHPNLKK